MAIDQGSLAVFSEDDEILFTSEYIWSMPTSVLLQPGEYIYMREYFFENAIANATIGDFKFSVKEYEYTPKEIVRIPCEARFDLKGADSFDNYIYVTFENTEAEEMYDFYICAALLDANGQVVFAESRQLDTVAVHPGSSITVKMYVDSYMLKYYAANGIEPASVDAMVCFF